MTNLTSPTFDFKQNNYGWTCTYATTSFCPLYEPQNSYFNFKVLPHFETDYVSRHYHFARSNSFFLAFSSRAKENFGYKRRPEEICPSSDLLNNTNLTRRSVCLEPILVSPLSKIHHHFSFFQTFRLGNFAQGRRLELNYSNTISTFERVLSALNTLLPQLRSVDHPPSFVESWKKDFTMRTTDYNDLLSTSHSNVLNFRSTKLNSTQQFSPPTQHNNAQWARTFIKNHHLTTDSLRTSVEFRQLNRTQKQAIYYQLRRQKKSAPLRKISSKRKKGRGVLPLPLASLLMAPTFLTEYLVLTFSYLFYLSLGLSPSMAIASAICVELFFMLTSSSQRQLFQTLRWAIFAYSAFTVCYSTYLNDSNIRSLQGSLQETTTHLHYQLDGQKKIIDDLRRQQDALYADMDIYRQNHLITKGRANLKMEKEQVRSDLLLHQKKLEQIISSISKAGQKQRQTSLFSWESLRLIQVQSWCVMAFLALIQFLSSICTHEFCQSFRQFRYKQKKQLIKGDYHVRTTAHIAVQ